MKELAKLQAKYDALSLDDSRAAKAERASIAEEMADLQDEINEMQADRMVETTENALDEMKKSYEAEKDAEIKDLEDSISSTEKLYRMAMDYLNTEIKGDYEKLRDQLLQWNYDIGSSFQSEIETAVDNAIAALERFGGSYKDAVSGVDSALQTANTSGQNLKVGDTYYSDKVDNSDMVSAIVGRMKGYAGQWKSTNTKALNDSLHEKAALEAAQLDRYGVHADFRSDGSWIITKDENDPSKVGKNLYQVYHGGTSGVGGVSTLKQDEVFAKLQKGEMVLTQEMSDRLSTQIERMGLLESAFAKIPDYVGKGAITKILEIGRSNGMVNNVTNTSKPSVVIGDTVIYGANQETARKHQEITEDFTEKIFGALKIKRSLFH